MDARISCIWSLGQGTREEIVKWIEVLKHAGVSLESRDHYGRSLLCVYVRSEPVVDALIKCGADLNAVGSLTGRGALHEYVSTPGFYSSVEGLRKLVQKSLDPHLLDKDGNNLLHIAAPPYRGVKQDIEFVKQLLDFGLSPNDQNFAGQTAL
jgi:ankyrin repeat protein